MYTREWHARGDATTGEGEGGGARPLAASPLALAFSHATTLRNKQTNQNVCQINPVLWPLVASMSFL